MKHFILGDNTEDLHSEVSSFAHFYFIFLFNLKIQSCLK